jgi:hypothetical protein
MSVRRTAAALLTAALLLAGCSDDPEPRFEPTETPTPTETPSAAEPQAQSPEEFIREWVALDRDMQRTGETEAYLAVSDSCGTCRDFAKRVEKVYAAGGSIDTRGWTVRQLTQKRPGLFSLEVTTSETSVTPSADAAPEVYQRTSTSYEIEIDQSDAGWIVTDWYGV